MQGAPAPVPVHTLSKREQNRRAYLRRREAAARARPPRCRACSAPLSEAESAHGTCYTCRPLAHAPPEEIRRLRHNAANARYRARVSRKIRQASDVPPGICRRCRQAARVADLCDACRAEVRRAYQRARHVSRRSGEPREPRRGQAAGTRHVSVPGGAASSGNVSETP
ncbi:hypothetical protein WJX74_009871 [Apatococcus lobatus]|uniref:Uncharacterized protein n=1 Tax=Apatococcus lobatus TaxID=904363 RepID=A0AAW1Q2E4_9CHLO